jgi:alanine-synthesizing transaminase
VAAPTLLSARHVTIAAIQARLAKNLAVLQSATTGTALSLLDVEGGWYGTLRLPRVESEEAWVLRFLQEDHVYVHPGHFFDFAEEAYVVLSLLTAEEPFAEGVRRIVARVASLV